MSMPRSRATVSARARSRLADVTPAVFSSSPVASWKRSPKTSLRTVLMRWTSSSSCRSRSSLAVTGLDLLALDEFCAHRQLVAGQAHRLAGQRLGHAGQLEHHAARLDDRHPALGRALAGAHAGLGRLLGDGLVGIDVDPHLAAALDLAGHRDSRRFDLAVGEPAGVERLDAVLAELHLGLAARDARAAPAVLLAVLDALR